MISVIITCHKKEEYLKECIDSVLFQTRPADEIILVHDGCESPVSYKEVDTIILRENHGVTYARDVGFRYSKGDKILFVDGDDKLIPDFIEKMDKADADVAYCDYVLFGKGAKLVKAKYTQKIFNRIVISSMMKREVYETLNGFRNLPIYEDWDFWVRARLKGFTFKKVNTLLLYRQVVGSHVRTISNKQKRKIYEDIFKLSTKSI